MKKRTLAHENDWYYNNYIMRLLIVEDEYTCAYTPGD